jgi:hypothetical protein
MSEPTPERVAEIKKKLGSGFGIIISTSLLMGVVGMVAVVFPWVGLWYILGALFALQVGASVYRMFKEKDWSQTIFLGGWILVAVMLAASWGPQFMQGREEERLLAEGVPTPAVIAKVEDTGNRFNSTPELRITLEVRPEGVSPYEVTVTKVAYPLWQLGSEVTVYVDPANSQNVAFVTE